MKAPDYRITHDPPIEIQRLGTQIFAYVTESWVSADGKYMCLFFTIDKSGTMYVPSNICETYVTTQRWSDAITLARLEVIDAAPVTTLVYEGIF